MAYKKYFHSNRKHLKPNVQVISKIVYTPNEEWTKLLMDEVRKYLDIDGVIPVNTTALLDASLIDNSYFAGIIFPNEIPDNMKVKFIPGHYIFVFC